MITYNFIIFSMTGNKNYAQNGATSSQSSDKNRFSFENLHEQVTLQKSHRKIANTAECQDFLQTSLHWWHNNISKLENFIVGLSRHFSICEGKPKFSMKAFIDFCLGKKLQKIDIL